MKWFIGFFVLLIALVAISGCTQSAQPVAPATTIPTTVPTPEPVLVFTTVPTTQATPVPTPKIVTRVPTTAAANMVTKILISPTGFNPAVDVVLPGTGIFWVNTDTVPHTVKSTGVHAGMFNSGEIIPTSMWSYDFGEKEGTFEYILDNNPKISGTIIVKAGRSVVGG